MFIYIKVQNIQSMDIGIAVRRLNSKKKKKRLGSYMYTQEVNY